MFVIKKDNGGAAWRSIIIIISHCVAGKKLKLYLKKNEM